MQTSKRAGAGRAAEPSEARAERVRAANGGWTVPRPARVPRPTFWPATLALASIFLLWGVVTSWLIALLGLAGFVLAIGGWIGEMRDEHDDES